MGSNTEKIRALAEECGFECIGMTDASVLRTYPEVRDMCAANKCHVYDHNWACPPACPTIEEYQRAFGDYDECIVVQSVGELEDDFDIETMEEVARNQKERFAQLVDKVAELDIPAMYLAAGTCTICPECSYPEKPCRFPQKRHTSMEASGMLVSEVCTQAGIPYNHGKNTMAYTSCVLY